MKRRIVVHHVHHDDDEEEEHEEGHLDADDVFSSWGMENPCQDIPWMKFSTMLGRLEDDDRKIWLYSSG
jgi:hypothetical protein